MATVGETGLLREDWGEREREREENKLAETGWRGRREGGSGRNAE
jgi:hypothetical protein